MLSAGTRSTWKIARATLAYMAEHSPNEVMLENVAGSTADGDAARNACVSADVGLLKNNVFLPDPLQELSHSLVMARSL